MQVEQNFGQKSSSYGTIFREIATSTRDLLRGELLLAKAELKEGSRKVAANFLRAILAASLLFASLIPLTALLVLGIGALIGSYIGSSAIVFALYGGTAGILFSRLAKKMREDEALLSKLRHVIEKNKNVMEEKMGDIQEAAEWRKAV